LSKAIVETSAADRIALVGALLVWSTALRQISTPE